MEHLSAWHDFNPSDRSTYPRTSAPVQVRFGDGKVEEGDSRMLFPRTNLLPISSISAWRYMKGSFFLMESRHTVSDTPGPKLHPH